MVKELLRQLSSANRHVRHSDIRFVRCIADLQQKSLRAIVQPHADVLAESVAPRKHLKLRHYPTQTQIGLLEALEFCSSAQPQLFTLSMANADHAGFFHELVAICAEATNTSAHVTPIVPTTTNAANLLEQQQQQQQQQASANGSSAKSNTASGGGGGGKVTSEQMTLRKAALNTLASLYHLLDQRELVLSTLHRALASPNTDIQQTTFACLKKYIAQTESFARALQQQHQQQVCFLYLT